MLAVTTLDTTGLSAARHGVTAALSAARNGVAIALSTTHNASRTEPAVRGFAITTIFAQGSVGLATACIRNSAGKPQ